jgi:type 1 glutamine amidotransferase
MTRRIRISGFLALSAVLAVAAAWVLTPAAGAQQPAAKKKVLIVWGGWPGHQPKETVDVFAPWLAEQGFDVEISNSLDSYLDAEKLKSLALIVQAVTMGTITPQQERGLRDAVRGGVGLAGWHGGLADSFRANTEYQFMVGGSWVARQGNTTDYTVNITKRDDPIMKGLLDFKMQSGAMPCSWTRAWVWRQRRSPARPCRPSRAW